MCPFSPTVGVQETRSRTAQNSVATRLAAMQNSVATRLAAMQWIFKLLDVRT
jgi:hypothetical protein